MYTHKCRKSLFTTTPLRLLAILVLTTLSGMIGGQPLPAAAQTLSKTSFTYQGQLLNNGSRLTATCGFQFTLYDAATVGNIIGATQTVDNVAVQDSYFTAQIDFGETPFGDAVRYLDLAVKCLPETVFSPLDGRIPLTAAPTALVSQRALVAPWSGLSGIPMSLMSFSSLTCANGQVSKWNGTVWGCGDLGVSTDTLASLNCVNGQIAKWNGTLWACAVDIDANTNVSGGVNNTASGIYATVIGGESNTASSTYATVVGGKSNTASSTNATVGGGLSNTASSTYATVGGGSTNTASSESATVSGGSTNTASEHYATVGGGSTNTASQYYATIAGGFTNLANRPYTTVGGGGKNFASNDYATIGGGESNAASALYATVGGGANNAATDDYGTVGGGANNQAGNNTTPTTDKTYATVAGGQKNIASGQWSVVAGGQNNIAFGEASFAAGSNAQAKNAGAFVWADDNAGIFASTAANEFAVRAIGGVRFVTSVAGTAGIQLAAGSSSWSILSDRNAKANFVPVDSQEVLRRVAALPLTTWNYKTQEAKIRHMGPMAQDLYQAFGLGEDEKHISTIDADGVALGAIQGLAQQVEAQQAEIAALKIRLTTLEGLLKQK